MSKKNKLNSSKKSKILSKISLKSKSSEIFRSKKNISEIPQCSSSTQIRQRKQIQVLDPPVGFDVPHCSHGPCLFFMDGKGRRWFSCAVYRSNKCSFRVEIPKNLEVAKWENQKSINFDYHYGRLKNRLKHISSSKNSIYWCRKCFDFVELPHQDPVQGPIEKTCVFPSNLLPSLEDDHGAAQYWFSKESLQVIEDVVIKEEFDSILCIGAPTIFERFYNSKKGLNLFMLDFDHRFAQFYSKSEFAHYSMLVNYFNDEDSRSRFHKFLAQTKNLVLICDPPFGVFIEALMKSIDAIKSQFLLESSSEMKNFRVILVLPIFVGKHVLKNAEFSMIDFKITYTNHKQFRDPEKSIVRIFTNISPNSFVLPVELGYRYCSICERYVCKTNKHCDLCGICPSKDGSTYKHCIVCKKCVKPTYVHCKKCSICHLKNRCI